MRSQIADAKALDDRIVNRLKRDLERAEEQNTQLRLLLRETAGALNDAIQAAVNADWDQKDYDEWDEARRHAEAELAAA